MRAHSQQKENSFCELEIFHKYSLQLPTMHVCQGLRIRCLQLEEKKKLLRGGLIVYSVWNALAVSKSSRDTLTKPVRLP